MRLALLLVILIVFSGYTISVMASHGGPFGFIDVARTVPWAMQLSLDLCLMLALFGVWMWRDAKSHGINPWPFLAMLSFGSPGPFIYLVRRELKLRATESLKLQ